MPTNPVPCLPYDKRQMMIRGFLAADQARTAAAGAGGTALPASREADSLPSLDGGVQQATAQQAQVAGAQHTAAAAADSAGGFAGGQVAGTATAVQ